MDNVTRLLEGVGCIVAGTLSDTVAVDLANSSDYDAVLIGDEVPQLDGGYIAAEARIKSPSMPVIIVHSPESVLTQLRLAGVTL